MAYSVEIIRKEEQITSTWPGGTTTQLAIYPKTSDYKARNFMWRLSSARVDADESTFTSMPEIWRHIMIIDGEMRLLHEGHHSVLLRPFEQDSFSGGWATKSIGRARDFNLMLGQGCKGELEAMFIGKEMKMETAARPAAIDFANRTDGFYCPTGSINVVINEGKTYILNEGDLMLLNSLQADERADITFRNIGQKTAAIIKAGISY